MRSMPSTASSTCSSSAKVRLSGFGRSRPYEFTFWPSSVISRTPSAARFSTSATSSRAGRRELLDLSDQLVRRPAHLAPARRRHDAVGAHAVAADADLHPGLEVALALHREMAGESLELEEALGRDAVAREELGELRHLPRAEGDVDERELLEHLVLDRLRPAAAHADDAGRVLLLEALGLAEVAYEPVVG